MHKPTVYKPLHPVQRYTFDNVGDGYQFTTDASGLWVMAKDVDMLERELAEAKKVHAEAIESGVRWEGEAKRLPSETPQAEKVWPESFCVRRKADASPACVTQCQGCSFMQCFDMVLVPSYEYELLRKLGEAK